MCDEQCCAPINANVRCANAIVCGSRFHCESHFGTARTLYRQYKLACEVADKCDLTRLFLPTELQKEIAHYTECYKSLIKAYDGRMKHRKYAFCPETWDEGHQTQFRILQSRIDICEKRLDTLYDQQQALYESTLRTKQAPTTPTRDSDSDTEDKRDVKTAVAVRGADKRSFTSVVKFRRRRVADDAEIDRLLKSYIKQNQVVMAEREKMFDLATSVLMSFVPPPPATGRSTGDCKSIALPPTATPSTPSTAKTLLVRENDADEPVSDDEYDDGDEYDSDDEYDLEAFEEEYYQMVGIYHLARKLFEIGYFQPGYEPRKCTGCNCGRVASEYIKLGCGCVFKHVCLEDYLKRMTIGSLRNMTTILLKHKKKLAPLVNDYLFALKIYGPQILIMKTELEWSPSMGRLKFKDDVDSREPITSKWLAQFRKPLPRIKRPPKSKSKSKPKLNSQLTAPTATALVKSG